MAIDIYEYTNYRDYLRDWLVDRKKRPSLRQLAAGVECSPALLSAILKSQRSLEMHRVAVFCRKLGLSGDEALQFTDLVGAEEMPSLAERRGAAARVVARRRFSRARRIGSPLGSLFSAWYIPAVAELARIPGFRDDPAWIARALDPAITEIEAADALAILEALGILRRGPEGLRASDEVWTTGHEVDPAGSAAVRAHTSRMLDLAKRALEEVPGPLRHFETFTVPVSTSTLPAIKQAIARFQVELAHICDSTPGDRLYQFGVQFFPVSESSDDPPTES